MSAVTNPIQACSEVFVRPRAVFEALKTRNNWSWVPFILTAIIGSLPGYLYFTSVDQDYYHSLLKMSPDFRDLSPAEIETALSFTQTADIAMYVPIGSVLAMIVVTAIIAIYYKAVTGSDEENLAGFTDWYGACWWIGMPTVIGAVISILMILLGSADGQIHPSLASATSIGNVLNIGLDSAWFNFANSVRLEMVWNYYIAAVAIGTWTRFAFNKCLLLAGLPYVLIYGVWALFLIF